MSGILVAEGPGDPDELALVAAGFPAYRIWRQTFYDRTRYTAQARDLTIHPNTVVTADLAELHAALLDDPQTAGQ